MLRGSRFGVFGFVGFRGWFSLVLVVWLLMVAGVLEVGSRLVVGML